MKTTKQIFQNYNNSILIPEKGSDFEYHKGMSFTDPFDEAFNHPFECSLSHIKSEQREEETILFI